MTLHIDTSSNLKTIVRLGTQEVVEESRILRSQVVLPIILSLLKKQGKNISDITEITVNPGPGSFTGVRVGVAIANALGYALNVPVNKAKSVNPVYD